MNIVDYVMLAVIAASVLFGLYRGFVASMLSTGGSLISLGLSFWLTPRVAELLQQNVGIRQMLLSYTDADKLIADASLAGSGVTDLSAGKISEIVSSIHLPAPLDGLLQSSMTNLSYGAASVKDYVSETLITAAVSVISFVITFIAVYIVISLLLDLLRAVVRFPVLKQLNAVVGGVFGLLRGILFVFILFALVPIVETMLPIQMVSDLVSTSALAPIFGSGGLLISIVNSAV